MLKALFKLIPLLAGAATVAEEGERKRGVILFVGGVMDQHELHAVMRAALFGER